MTPKQNKVLAALLTAPSKAAAAQAAGISPRTLRGYLSNPTFRQAYREAQSELLESAVCQSRQHLTGALSALADITADANAPPAARVSAARASVELALKLGEQNDIMARLDELERTIGGDKAE